MSLDKSKYLKPGTALAAVGLISILLVWLLPAFKSYGDTSYSSYWLFFNKEYKVRELIWVFVFHLIALALTLAGDIKITKAIVAVLCFFNMIIYFIKFYSVGVGIQVGFVFTIILYFFVIGAIIYDFLYYPKDND